jgi:hypothetical protein
MFSKGHRFLVRLSCSGSLSTESTSGRQFLESKWLIFKSKWPWIKKIVFWYGVWDSICKFVSNLLIEIKSQKSKSSLRFEFTFVMRMSWLVMAQLCSVTQSSDNGLDHLGQWLASNNGLVPVNRWVLHAVTKLNCNQANWLLSRMTCSPPVSAHLSDAKVNAIA